MVLTTLSPLLWPDVSDLLQGHLVFSPWTPEGTCTCWKVTISGAVEEVASGTRSSCGAGEGEQFLGVGRCSDTHLELANSCLLWRERWLGWLADV